MRLSIYYSTAIAFRCDEYNYRCCWIYRHAVQITNVSTWDKSYERVVKTSSKDLLGTDKVVSPATMSAIEFDNESGRLM